MQDQQYECEECTDEPEEFVCATCGLTGSEIADLRWHARLWEAVDKAA